MNQIRISTEDNSRFFDIPWSWISKEGVVPQLNDLEATAERSVVTATLYRNRLAEIPNYKLSILKSLKQSEVFPLLDIIRNVKIKITYFEPYSNAYVTKDFYAKKPDLTIRRLPLDNNTNNIVYNPFEITFTGYSDVRS